MPPPKSRLCRHCGDLRYIQARGLCFKCHKNLDIRAQYARYNDFAAPLIDPTAEELDALEREQRANPPSWWAREEERRRAIDENAADPRPKIVLVMIAAQRLR